MIEGLRTSCCESNFAVPLRINSMRIRLPTNLTSEATRGKNKDRGEDVPTTESGREKAGGNLSGEILRSD